MDSLDCVSSREIRIEDEAIGFYAVETEQVHCSGTSVMTIDGLEEDAQVYINEQAFSYADLPLLEPGVYRISTPAESEGCEWNETVIILESTCPEEEPGSVWFPNVFSPNFDGYNDEFSGIVHNAEVVELSIYDRWGQTVFHSSTGEAWKGVNRSGQAADQGVYVYFAVIRKADGQRMILGGDVTLLR